MRCLANYGLRILARLARWFVLDVLGKFKLDR